MTHEFLASELTWPDVSFESVDEANQHLDIMIKRQTRLRAEGRNDEANILDINIGTLAGLICEIEFSLLT